MPKLLKRLSSKFLKKNGSRRRSSSSSSNSVPLPPGKQSSLVLPKENESQLAGDQHSSFTAAVMEPNATGNSPSNTNIVKTSTNANGEFPAYLVDAWTASHTAQREATGVEKFLNTVEDGFGSTSGTQTVMNTVVKAPINALLAVPDVASGVEQGVNTFLAALPPIMKALDAVGKVHPFINVVVLAFQAAYTLEMTRRSNDKRVKSLYDGMEYMLDVLVQLKDMKDLSQKRPDGETMEDHLRGLCNATAKDIEDCGNTCDAYLKKKLITKIIAGPLWEGKLAGFVVLFADRRKDFEFALIVHTAVGMDDANIKLDRVEANAQEIKEKMDMVLRMFQKFVPPEEAEMKAVVFSGENAALDNPEATRKILDNPDTVKKILGDPATAKKILEMESKADGATGRQGGQHSSEVADLLRDIREDPDIAIKRNAELFDKKFAIQRRKIKADIERSIRREGDRIISAVTAGPHDRIIDKDIFEIWKDMGWKGSAKSRHFVLALRDYYNEMIHNSPDQQKAVADKWAIDYIAPHRAQLIMEAFDDDCSGFITVQEANTFTQLRPRDWSLPHWVAYWAVGWPITVADYCRKIDKILSAMFHLLDDLKELNRGVIDEMLLGAWSAAMTFTHPVEKVDVDAETAELKDKFEPWVSAEEERLKKDLEEIHYHIDTPATVALITGPERVEMFLYPLLYLILKHHLDIISLGRKYTLKREEIHNAMRSLYCVLEVASSRLKDIRGIFKQQRLDIETQLRHFALGMFVQLDKSDAFGGDVLRTLPDPEPVDESIIPSPDLDPTTILRFFQSDDQDAIDYNAYNSTVAESQEQPVGAADPILGPWHAVSIIEKVTIFPKFSFVIERNSEENGIYATGLFNFGGNSPSFVLEGYSKPEVNGIIIVDFILKFNSILSDISFSGRFDVEEETIRGTWAAIDMNGEFVLKRRVDSLRLYPPPVLLREDRVKNLWQYAISWVRNFVSRKLWSKRFFMDRLRARKQYIDLATRRHHFGKTLTQPEATELAKLCELLDPADIRFCASLIMSRVSKTSINVGFYCDWCGSALGNIRVVCMDCHSTGGIDFCEDPVCEASTIPLRAREDLAEPHVPSHEVFKVYRMFHSRYYAMTERKAKAALQKAKELLSLDQGNVEEEAVRVQEANNVEEANGVEKADREEVVDREAGNEKGEEQQTEKTEKIKRCGFCKAPVSLISKCWFCIDCNDDLFICDNCDNEKIMFDHGTNHNPNHVLVRCQPAEKMKVTTEVQLINVEERLIGIESRFSQIENILHSVLAKLDREKQLDVKEEINKLEDEMRSVAIHEQ